MTLSLDALSPSPTGANTPVTPSLRPGTDIHRVYLALSEFPGVPMTTRELVDETGLPIKQCSGYMWELRRRGLAHSRPSEHRNGKTLEHWVGELL